MWLRNLCPESDLYGRFSNSEHVIKEIFHTRWLQYWRRRWKLGLWHRCWFLCGCHWRSLENKLQDVFLRKGWGNFAAGFSWCCWLIKGKFSQEIPTVCVTRLWEISIEILWVTCYQLNYFLLISPSPSSCFQAMITKVRLEPEMCLWFQWH